MPKELERDLGLYATTTISVGAMIGSGIFVLPGLAAKIAGPAAITAYLLAGIIAMPAVLSKAEMATAMPDAGGTYLYIDRAMGPLMGTIAGVGAWFSLTFKSAFALVGLGAYLVLFSALPPKLVALVLAALLIVVNVVGVKQSGRLQSVIVTVVVAVLVLFIADGITYVDSAQYHPFFPEGRGSLLAATGFVFVSYAGVTKIASVAEEVENPGRNIPLAMLVSVLLMMLVYVLVVFVVIGVTDPKQLKGTLTPMAAGAAQFLGSFGVVLIAVVAVVALTSMANAGVLSASRFPFAMSRDELAPRSIEYIHERFHTPVVAILLTGSVLLVLIGFVPVLELAKLASAFKILVFSIVNVALVAFRESDLESYDPEFVSPGYPWVQLFGILAGVVLLTQMGTLPILGAVGIILGGLGWYHLYGRERTEREGAALDALRREAGRRAVDRTKATLAEDEGDVLVALGPGTSSEREATLLMLACAVASRHGGRVYATMFEPVPGQVDLAAAAEEVTPEDREFERRTDELAGTLPMDVEVEEVVAHDVRRAVANHAEAVGAETVLGAWERERFHAELLGEDVDWYMRHVPCDVAFVRDRGLGDVNEVAVLTTGGPYAPRKVALADAMAAEFGATLRFITAVGTDASAEQVGVSAELHDELDALCSVRTESEVVRTDDRVTGLVEAAAGADLTVAGTYAHNRLYDALVGDITMDLADELACTTVFVHTREPRRHTFLRHLFERFTY